MHKLIKQSLEKSFELLNNNLVSGSDHSKLDIVVNTLVKIINGRPYNDEIKGLFKNNPDINSSDVYGAVRNIVLMLTGRHELISQCYETNETQELGLAYIFSLTAEILDDLNCIIIAEDGRFIANQVEYIAFNSAIPNLGELSIVEDYS